MVDACTSAGILPFYGPYGDIRDTLGCETQFRAAFLLGCVGAWSLHPAQIEIAKQVFSPDPVEVKSQVLSGGRMKAGGVKFADTPEEAEGHARDILDLEIGGHMPRGVLIDTRAEVAHEYYAGVVWDGIRKRPVLLFSDMGGIDIEEVAEQHPDDVAAAHFSTLHPFQDWLGEQLIVSLGYHGW